MTLAINLRKMVHRKSAEYCAPCAAGATGSGAFIVSDKSDIIPGHDISYYVASAAFIWNYNADQDAWIQIPAAPAAGAFAAGACGEFRAISAPGGSVTNTATAGSTTTLTTNLTMTRSLAGCEIRVVGGAGVGYNGIINSNTLGANSVITVDVASGVAFGATTQYQMFGGSLWFFNSGTSAVGFSVYDRATNVWTARSVTGIPTAWGTDAQLVSTPGRSSNNGTGFVNGTATAGAASTITLEPAKTFLLNQWANMQVRIISGTGAGQIRGIASNTAGASPVVTVSAAWTVQPDATSVYRIEGNDDHFYLLGNNAVTMYRYTISTNTWATLAPVAARAGPHGAGSTADWIDAVQDSNWTDGSYGLHYTTVLVRQNGRYIYSLRSSNILDVYDIAANTWISDVSYGQKTEAFGAGSCSVDLDGYIYLQLAATGRIFRFDVAKNALEPWVLNPVPQGAAVAGDKMFMTTFNDGGSKINYLYTLGHTRAELTRWLVI